MTVTPIEDQYNYHAAYNLHVYTTTTRECVNTKYHRVEDALAGYVKAIKAYRTSDEILLVGHDLNLSYSCPTLIVWNNYDTEGQKTSEDWFIGSMSQLLAAHESSYHTSEGFPSVYSLEAVQYFYDTVGRVQRDGFELDGNIICSRTY